MRRLLCILFIPFFLTSCKKDKSAFENRILYEHHAPWYWKNSYKQVSVPVVIEGKVPAEFYTVKEYYQKTGEKSYEPVQVKVVNLKQWRVVEERRKDMLNKMFNFFMVVAGAGFVAFLAGVICFFYKVFLWDELLIGGGISGPFGLVSAWYVDRLPLIATAFVVCVIGFAGYMLWTRRKQHKGKLNAAENQEQMEKAFSEVVETTEIFKSKAAESWNQIKGTIEQSDTTRRLVDKVQVEVKKKLGIA